MFFTAIIIKARPLKYVIAWNLFQPHTRDQFQIYIIYIFDPIHLYSQGKTNFMKTEHFTI